MARVGDAATKQELVYEKLPSDIAERSVLLMDPMLGSGSSGVKAIEASTPPPHPLVAVASDCLFVH